MREDGSPVKERKCFRKRKHKSKNVISESESDTEMQVKVSYQTLYFYSKLMCWDIRFVLYHKKKGYILFRIQTNDLHSSVDTIFQPEPVTTKRQKIASKNAEQSKHSTNLANIIKERYKKVWNISLNILSNLQRIEIE